LATGVAGRERLNLICDSFFLQSLTDIGVFSAQEGLAHLEEGLAHLEEGLAHLEEGLAHLEEGLAHLANPRLST